MKHTKLTFPERKLISQWRSEGISKRECARRLGRNHATIMRELDRNKFDHKLYEPLHAQGKAETRKTKAWLAKHPLKNKDVFAYVIRKLRKGWSPEVISGRLREVEHSQDPSWHLCSETIYQFIYTPLPPVCRHKI